MMNIEKYVKVKNIDEAMAIITEDKASAVLGGCGYLRMGNRQISTAVDLSELGLNSVSDCGGEAVIGSMTSLRTLETDEILKKYFGNLFQSAACDIVGVQFRNGATIGGTVCGKYPFSDILTALCVLDADVVFAEAGRMSLETYLDCGTLRDVLLEIRIKTNIKKAVFKSIRNSHGDYSILNIACAVSDDGYRVALGARPKRAERVISTDKEILPALCAERYDFGDNLRASAQYRKAVAPALIKSVLDEVSHAD